jgi:hypothetical protein
METVFGVYLVRVQNLQNLNTNGNKASQNIPCEEERGGLPSLRWSMES